MSPVIASDDDAAGRDRSLHLDVSVRDVATAFIGPALLDYAMNQREQAPQGNGNGAASPYGVYRCKGDDQWVSIAVTSDEEWRGLCRALGSPGWTGETRFGDGYQRWLHRAGLDQCLEEWTRQRTPWEVTREYCKPREWPPSLPCPPTSSWPTLTFRPATPSPRSPTPIEGRQRGVAPPWRFDRTPARLDGWTPELGEDNDAVFHGLMGIPIEEVRALQEAKVIW